MSSEIPLAEKLRPKDLSEVIGQDHLVGKDGFITSIIKNGKPLSIILFGPPGSGKTSIARLYAKAFSLQFENLSAVFSGVADLKKILKDGENTPLFNKRRLLFVDEIHRFNKAQQDAFLPYVENGTIVLVGATAENPSFYLNKALLSRVRTLKLEPLNDDALLKLVAHYEKHYHPLNLTDDAKEVLINFSGGDGRYLFNLIENLEPLKDKAKEIDKELLISFIQKRAPLFDKADEQHYNLISALHKSVRGSDPNAALYWLARMLNGGEEPLFIARRLIRMATEDIGLADPSALPLAIAAKDAYEMLGSPEGELALAETVVYLALAPKSNAIYKAFGRAQEAARNSAHLDPPSIILNAPTNLMKEIGYGKGYIYDHDTENSFSGQDYFPEDLNEKDFYRPVERGFEREMIKRINYFNNLKNKTQT